MSDEIDRELETALGALVPVAAELSREDVLFAAGRRFERRRGRVWKGIGGVAVIALAVAAAWRPPAPPRTVERIVYVEKAAPAAERVMVERTTPTPAPPATAAVETPLDSGYFALRERVLSRGLKALPPTNVGAAALGTPVEARWMVGRTGGRL